MKSTRKIKVKPELLTAKRIAILVGVDVLFVNESIVRYGSIPSAYADGIAIYDQKEMDRIVKSIGKK